MIELQNRLEHLELQNRRLAEDVSELRQQLNASDDALSSLRQENGELKKASKRL